MSTREASNYHILCASVIDPREIQTIDRKEVDGVVTKHIGKFKLFHLHITYVGNLCDGIRSTTLYLPRMRNGSREMLKQTMTTCKFTTMQGYLKLMELLGSIEILGFKVEGVNLCDGVDINFINFEYFEEHRDISFSSLENYIKNGIDADGFNVPGVLYSSDGKSRILTAVRNYDRYSKPGFKGEISICTVWAQDFERDWIKTHSKDQLSIIYKFLKPVN